VLPSDGAPLPLPAGWPYDAVAQIVAVRTMPFNGSAPTTTP
jgi:hypothetical protein